MKILKLNDANSFNQGYFPLSLASMLHIFNFQDTNSGEPVTSLQGIRRYYEFRDFLKYFYLDFSKAINDLSANKSQSATTMSLLFKGTSDLLSLAKQINSTLKVKWYTAKSKVQIEDEDSDLGNSDSDLTSGSSLSEEQDVVDSSGSEEEDNKEGSGSS